MSSRNIRGFALIRAVLFDFSAKLDFSFPIYKLIQVSLSKKTYSSKLSL